MIYFRLVRCSTESALKANNFPSVWNPAPPLPLLLRRNYAKLLVRERFGNALSILLVLFGAVVVYIVTKFEYRRVDLVTSERIRLSN